jgi:two-component SAPR family response regulator
MLSIFLLFFFVLTLRLGFYLFARSADNRGMWPVRSTLLSAAAAQLCALIASISSVEASAALWSRGILLFESLFLLSYTASSCFLASGGRDKVSIVDRMTAFSSYGISFVLAAVASWMLNPGGTIVPSELGWGLAGQDVGILFIGSALIVITLTVLRMLACRGGRLSHSSSNQLLKTLIAMNGLALAGMIPLWLWLSTQFKAIFLLLTALPTAILFGYAVWRLRPLLLRLSWSHLVLPFLSALKITLYTLISLAIMVWLIHIRGIRSPVLAAFALSSMAIGAIELLRLRLPWKFLGKILPPGNSEYYVMSRTIQRALIEQDLSRLMERVLNWLCKHWDVSKGFIAVNDGKYGLKIRAIYGMASLRLGDCVDLPVTNEPSFLSKTGQSFIEDMALLIPLRVQSSQHGMLVLGSRAIGDFSEGEVQLLECMAHQLSIAVENLELKRQISTQLVNLAAESGEVLHRQTLLLESLQSSITGLEAARQRPFKQVHVRCLGRFEVQLGRKIIQDREWGGRTSGHRHSKALFAYLVANRDRYVSRHKLIDVIWGDSAGVEILENRLDRTIFALRRALEPTLRRGAESSYIITSVEGYRLNPAIQWWTDAEEFSELIQEAEVLECAGDEISALAKYQEAERLYQGDYMIDCAFVDRSHQIIISRETLRLQYQSLLVRIAKLHQRNDSNEMGIRYLQQAALENEFNEKVYRALVRSYCEAGRRAEALLVCKTHSSVLARAGLPCRNDCLPPEAQS